MTELILLLDAQSNDQANKSLSAKAKEELEAQAALELCDAAMKGCVVEVFTLPLVFHLESGWSPGILPD